MPCLTPMCNTPWTNLHTSRVRLLLYLLILRICRWCRDPIQSPSSSSLFGHFGQKRGENFEGEYAQLRGSRAQSLVYCWQFSIFMFGLNFISVYNSWIVLLLSFKSLSTLFLTFSLIFSTCVCFFHCFVAFFQYFQMLLNYLEYYTLVPLQDLVSLMQILLVFCIGCVLDMQLILVLVLIALRVRMIIYELNVHCSHSLMTDLV